ncbi:MAG: HEAT repeat domain-containing protein [Candidatus Omnitrophota bacterium]|nr:MAG: HEAT repeat domain-containing protein [Candidatus Omnitrophota bacterium]
MKVIKPVLIIMVAMSLLSMTSVSFAQPSIPKENIPYDVPEDVKKQIERLYSSSAKERQDAAYELGEMGSRAMGAVPFLIEMLGEESVIEHDESGTTVVISARREARKALKKMGRVIAEPLIEAAVRSDNYSLLSQASRILRGVKHPDTVNFLRKSLEDSDSRVRKNAVYILGELKDFYVTEILVSALEDPDADVRANAAYGLGRTKDAYAIDPLITALGDDDADVRANAALALGSMEHDYAVEPLISVLADDDTVVRANAAQALGIIKDRRAIEPLITLLGDSEIEVRASAHTALQAITDQNLGQSKQEWQEWWGK